MPPNEVRQKGLRTASTCRAGSQKPMDRPTMGLTTQLHTGLLGLSMSSWSPKLAMRALPMLMGRMQDQQMSVIGFGNFPVQVATPAASAVGEKLPSVSARLDASTTPNRRSKVVIS